MNILQKFLFRTSGGPAPKNKEIGYGHLFRSISLAKSLKTKNIFFAIEDYGGSKKILKKNGFQNIKILKKNLSLKSDIRETKKIILEKNIDVLIIDQRKILHEYLNELNRFAKSVVIFDIYDYDFPSDLIINGFIGFKNQIKKNKFNKKCLLGPKYFILDKRYSTKIVKAKKNDILVTFGGFDASKLVETFLFSAEEFLNDISVKIILGPGTKQNKIIENFQKKYKKLKIIQSSFDMHKEISNSKFGICAGGFTTYEFAALGVPFAIISQVPHQLITAKKWEKLGVAKNLGLINNNTGKKITNLVRILQDKNFVLKPIKSHIDGLGVKRVSRQIKNL